MRVWRCNLSLRVDSQHPYIIAFADLCAEKDTIRILSDLNKAYPFATTEAEGDHQREIELTAALEAVHQKSGMMGVRLKGTMYDMGNPVAMRRCVRDYCKS